MEPPQVSGCSFLTCQGGRREGRCTTDWRTIPGMGGWLEPSRSLWDQVQAGFFREWSGRWLSGGLIGTEQQPGPWHKYGCGRRNDAPPPRCLHPNPWTRVTWSRGIQVVDGMKAHLELDYPGFSDESDVITRGLKSGRGRQKRSE